MQCFLLVSLREFGNDLHRVLFCILEAWLSRRGVAEWFRVLDLKSGGPWFKPFILPLFGFVLASPKFNSLTALCK